MGQRLFENKPISAEIARYLSGHDITNAAELQSHIDKSGGHRSIGRKMERDLKKLL